MVIFSSDQLGDQNLIVWYAREGLQSTTLRSQLLGGISFRTILDRKKRGKTIKIS